MRAPALAFLLLALTLLVAFAQADKPAPSYSNQYLVECVFNIPYFNTSEPIRMVYDEVNNRQAWNYYHGTDLFYYFFSERVSYQVVPVIGVETCQTFPSRQFAPLQSIFPTFDNTWSYQGTDSVNGVKVDYWLMTTVNFNQTGTYKFYADAQTGAPVRFWMNGVNIIFGSHPDIYVIDYFQYTPNYSNDTEFALPTLCNSANDASKEIEIKESHIATSVKKAFGELKETVERHENLFAEFAQKYQKKYHSVEERNFRKGVFVNHHNFISQFNTDKTKTFTLKMNHYGDLEREEFAKVMMPHNERPADNKATSVHKYDPSASLPDAIDWRVKNAVTMVKDQGACGSCWTFGSTGAIEGAWAIKTGNLVSVSEQQIVDCAWINWRQEETAGCNGGFAAPAFQWVIDNGGIATEYHYPYLAQDGFCRANDLTSGVQIKGYVNVTQFSEPALQSAVAIGPVAIAIDASVDTFRFYSSGVYYEPACKSGARFLDHEVLAVGYGNMNGQDFWIVKNSWSTHWGDEGYIYMARNRNNNCGIASQATYPTA